VFTLGAEQYALPIKQVQEIIRYKQPRSFTSTDYSVRGVINLRGRIIPVHDLAARLGVSTELTDHTMIMILETAAQTVGVIVDAVDEVLTVKADQLEQLPDADTTLTDSIAKLGDRLVVLLNPSTLFAATPLAA
jgi:purine-binding chemotaxis protein CheW